MCGCDGKTYGNDCLRLAAGAALSHQGSCTTPQPCSSLGPVECLTRADCEWKTTPGFPGPISICVKKTPTKTYCQGFCGGKSPDGCYCDSQCSQFGDCCPDVQQHCGSNP